VTRKLAAIAPSASSLQFIPVEMESTFAAGAAPVEAPALSTPDFHIQLDRGATRLSVRWPSTQAAACTT